VSRGPCSLVYLKSMRGHAIPIVWDDEMPTGPATVLAKHPIPEDKWHLSIDELMKIFPPPEIDK
jgi:hypothetical protein